MAACRTYIGRVVQKYGGGCQLSDEYDEDDGEELERKREFKHLRKKKKLF